MANDYPPHTLYPMPALSPTMEMGTIAKWTKSEGEAFAAGDVLCEIETDKATVDFEAQDDGVIAKILREGDDARDLNVGVPICVVVDDEEDAAAFSDYVAADDAGAGAAAAPEAEEAAAAPAPAAAASPAGPGPTAPEREVPAEFALMPAARSISQSRGVDATVLNGTGKGGRVTKGDVLKALADGVEMPPLAQHAAASAASTASAPTAAAAAAPAAPSPASPPVDVPIPPVSTGSTYEDVPNNNMRKVIAKRLAESKRDVPHFYTSMEIELDNALALRKTLQSKHDVKVSVNDLIIRSSALALRDVPEVNATYNPKTNAVSLQGGIDISVAVATPTGLITPIVPATDAMGLSDISSKVRDLATRARDGKLKPEEYQGGTFCISNLGMFGIHEFSAVINPPQAAILAVGGGIKKVVPTEWVDGAEEQPKPGVRTVMTARLSADRRVVDEATAGMFLSALRHYLSKPELLVL